LPRYVCQTGKRKIRLDTSPDHAEPQRSKISPYFV
jgi:hypothetical protein